METQGSEPFAVVSAIEIARTAPAYYHARLKFDNLVSYDHPTLAHMVVRLGLSPGVAGFSP